MRILGTVIEETFNSDVWILVKDADNPLIVDTLASETLEMGASKDMVRTTRLASMRL